jgi:hypothetical protein
MIVNPPRLCAAHHLAGYKAAGDAAALQRLAAQAGMACTAVPLVAWPHGGGGEWASGGESCDSDGLEGPTTVSSSRVRARTAV